MSYPACEDEAKRVYEIKQYIRTNEGYERMPYQCSEGYWTCGVGHKMDGEPSEYELKFGWTDEFIESTFNKDFYKAVVSAWDAVPTLKLISHNRRKALVDMSYQMGSVKAFRKMLKGIAEKDFDYAADEILDSLYAKQTKRRAKKNSNYMRLG